MDEIELKMRRIDYWEKTGVIPEDEMIEMDMSLGDDLLMKKRDYYGPRYGKAS